MDEIIKNLKEEILLVNEDTDNIISELERIKGNTLCIGTGGSRVVAEYVSLVLKAKNNIASYVMDARDINYINLNFYDNIFISSYSGSNCGVKTCLENDLKKYLLSSRKTLINNEVNLGYNLLNEHSFISIKSTIIPMSIMLKYYLKENFKEIIEKIFSMIDKNIYLECNSSILNIFTGIDSKVASTFLESTFIESGMIIPILHEKYNYCHGRANINKNHNYSSIYLRYLDNDLDKLLVDVLKDTMSNVLVIDSKFQDYVVDEFYMTILLLYLLRNIAYNNDVDLKDIDYDKEAIKRLYYFKGSM